MNLALFFAAEDLCLIKYLKWFCVNNIDAIKIEGRNKTSSYLGVVIDVYKTALKDLQEKKIKAALISKGTKKIPPQGY